MIFWCILSWPLLCSHFDFTLGTVVKRIKLYKELITNVI